MIRIRWPLIGLILLALSMFLSACSAKHCPSARPMLPPVVYLQEVPEPQLKGRTNKALLDWAVELREALRLANGDKKALRDWVTQYAE